MTRIAFVGLYLTAMAAAVILFNANIGADQLAIGIWAAASILLGWKTGNLAFALLAFLAIPFAVPFGYPDDYQYSEPLPIWWGAAVLACGSACLIFLTALLKMTFGNRRNRQPPSRA